MTCSTSLVIKEMQIKTIWNTTLQLPDGYNLRKKRKKTNEFVSRWLNEERREPLYIASGNITRCNCCGKQKTVPQKAKHRITIYDPVIPLLDAYPKNWKQELKQMCVHQCSQQHWSQYTKDGNNSNFYQQMSAKNKMWYIRHKILFSC